MWCVCRGEKEPFPLRQLEIKIRQKISNRRMTPFMKWIRKVIMFPEWAFTKVLESREQDDVDDETSDKAFVADAQGTKPSFAIVRFYIYFNHLNFACSSFGTRRHRQHHPGSCPEPSPDGIVRYVNTSIPSLFPWNYANIHEIENITGVPTTSAAKREIPHTVSDDEDERPLAKKSKFEKKQKANASATGSKKQTSEKGKEPLNCHSFLQQFI